MTHTPRPPRIGQDTHNALTYYDGIRQERCRRCLRLAVDCTCDPPALPVPTSPDSSGG